MKPIIRKIILVLAAATLLLVLASCQKRSDKLATGIVLTRTEMTVQSAMLDRCVPEYSSALYAQVNAAALPGLEAQFQSELSQHGVPVSLVNGSTGWEERFNCTGFCDYFVGLADVTYFTQEFQSAIPAPRLALIEVWYIPAGAVNGTGHAIILALTDKGPVFWDPQVGLVTLTAAELATVYHRSS